MISQSPSRYPLGVSKALSTWTFQPTVKPVSKCNTCDKDKVIECPCGTASCKLVTELSNCPTCEPAAVTRELKFKGARVCRIVVAKELAR